MKKTFYLLIAFIFVTATVCLLSGCGKSDAVVAVENLINQIGNVTLDSKQAIEDAEEAYGKLTDEDKKAVENYEILTSAQTKFGELEREQKAREAEMLAEEERKKEEELLSSIVGVWEGELFGIKMVYEFLDDGTYKNYAQASSSAVSIKGTNGTYSFDGKNLSLNASNGNVSTLTIALAGDRMIVTVPYSGKSMDIIYSKVK